MSDDESKNEPMFDIRDVLSVNKNFDVLIEEHRKYYNNLSFLDKIVLNSYTRGAWLNDWLGADCDIKSVPLSDLEDFFFVVNKAHPKESVEWFFNNVQRIVFNAPRSSTPIVLYRGVKKAPSKKKSFISKGVVSTTYDSNITKRFGKYRLNAHLPPDTPMFIIDVMSAFKDEREVILLAGSEFSVGKRRRDVFDVNWIGCQFKIFPEMFVPNKNLTIALKFHEHLKNEQYNKIKLPKYQTTTIDLFRTESSRLLLPYLKKKGYKNLKEYEKKNNTSERAGKKTSI